MSRTIAINHLGRVEGHGGITVEMDGDAVRKVELNLFEGARLLEALVRGRSVEDVPQIASRICAICSVAHTLTSIKAIECALGVEISEQTEWLRDLMYRGESIESHSLHIFLLAMPDYTKHPNAIALAADEPELVRLGLRLKKMGNTIQETVGGRAVHPVNAVLGGFGRLPTHDQLLGLRDDLARGLADSEAMLDRLAALPSADFCHSDTVFVALNSPTSYGYYRGDEIIVLSNGSRHAVRARDYRRLCNEESVTHSHAKHSTRAGAPFMVGALARLAVNLDKVTGHAARAIERLALRLPSDNPLDNNKAQAVEIILDIEHGLHTVNRLLEDGLTDEPPARFHARAGTGTAVTEAPRGLLVHSYTLDEEGRVAAADVITPTAINAASIERHLRQTIEQSRASPAPALTHRLEMLARAYDPCISCAVHLIRLGDDG